VLAKPALEAWKSNELLTTLYRMMMNPDEAKMAAEPLEAFFERVVAESKKPVAEAADRGQRYHYIMEQHLLGETSLDPYSFDPSVQAAISWTDKHLAGSDQGGHPEEVLMNLEDGYGGRTDYRGPYFDGLTSQVVIADYKSRKVVMTDYKKKENRPDPQFYDEDLIQLMSHARSLWEQHGVMANGVISVIISTGPVPGCYQKFWSKEDMERGAAMWEAAHALWRLIRRFPYEHGQMELGLLSAEDLRRSDVAQEVAG